MAGTKYAAIHIGSYELQLKIYEMTSDKNVKILENIRYAMELGKETYTYRKLSFQSIDVLCDVLFGFTQTIKEYKILEYDAVATSCIREADNMPIILDRIEVKTGLKVRVLSNSEERFINYKALFLYEEHFKKYNSDKCGVIDVGSGSIQISLMEKNALVATQNILLGTMRISEMLYNLSDDIKHFYTLVDELMGNEWQTFKRMFLKENEIEHIIAVGTPTVMFSKKVCKNEDKVMTKEEFIKMFESMSSKSTEQLVKEYQISEEQAILIIPCLRIYGKILEDTNVKSLWFPETNLLDGLAVDFGIRIKKLNISHSFENDITNTAKNIAKRYKVDQSHVQLLRETSAAIFDATKKIHGMGKRERLLLEIAALLHDCGKYVSLTSMSQCSYDIIMATEIIGLSHMERELIANIVKYNTVDYTKLSDLTMLKLIAILRVANALDRSHKQKFKTNKIQLKGNELIISSKGNHDITLERGLFTEKADFFEEVYGIRPILKTTNIVRG